MTKCIIYSCILIITYTTESFPVYNEKEIICILTKLRYEKLPAIISLYTMQVVVRTSRQKKKLNYKKLYSRIRIFVRYMLKLSTIILVYSSKL